MKCEAKGCDNNVTIGRDTHYVVANLCDKHWNQFYTGFPRNKDLNLFKEVTFIQRMKGEHEK